MAAKRTGLLDGAHPTAPGGMSQDALLDELIEKHGWKKKKAKALTWPQKIDTVGAERRARELEKEAADIEAQVSSMAEARDEALASAPQPLLVLDPDTNDYVFDGHSGAGPSGSSRWLDCTASLGLSREFLETLTPNQQHEIANANAAAREGTTAHRAAEAEAGVLLGLLTHAELDAALLELSTTPPTGEEYTEEMGEWITEYTDLVKLYRDEGREIMIENRVTAAVPLVGAHDGEVYEATGSADFIALPMPKGTDLVVGDLKYGNGVEVDVEENSQARIYALGVLTLLADDEGNLPDIDTITYHIIQPRLGGTSTWSESVDDLLDWRDEVLAPGLTAALYGKEAGAEFVPTESNCQFCPARGVCNALLQQRTEQAIEVFDVILETEVAEGEGSLPAANLMDSATLAGMLNKATSLVKLQEDLKKEVQRRLHRGEQVPGYHLVSYTPRRTWKEAAEEALAPGGDLLGDDAAALWVEKLVTPTAALKLLPEDKRDLLDALIDVPDKRPVGAPVTDKRKAWDGKAPEDMFAIEPKELP